MSGDGNGGGRTLVSLFCGAGGLDLGFHRAGFECLWANDFNEDACDTFRSWSGADVVCGDIGKVDFSDIPESDVISGGFPCFPAGTPVLTSSGWKPIEEILPGDSVLSHAGVYREVLAAGSRIADGTVVLEDATGRVIEATGNHPFQARVAGSDGWSWVPARDVGPGMEWHDVQHGTWLPVTDARPGRNGGVTVYNLEVACDESYTAAGIAVHNCQGFSAGGPRKLDDSRNSLYRHFVRLVAEKKPRAFVAENVKGLLSIGGSDDVARAIVADFADKGYDVSLTLVNAADYGVPEDRNRIVIVGVRRDIGRKFYMPAPTGERRTLRDAIGDMGPAAEEDVSRAAFSSRYMSRNRKRGWDDVSFTIPAMAKQVPLWPGSPDMVRVGRDSWEFGDGETRRLSWREAAAVQTFPPDIEFAGNLTSKYKQVGNAVPPQLGYVVANRLKAVLDGDWEPVEGSDDWVEPAYASWLDN